MRILYIAFLDSYFWYLVLLIFDLIGVSSYGLGGFSKEKHKFHGVGSPPGGIFEKKDNLQNQECHFLKIACYPILIPDSEST